MVHVTAAIIERDGKLLLCQRPSGKRCEFLWEFPGGKIESGETPEEALARECKEELDIEIRTEKLVEEVIYQYPEITVSIGFYFCKIIDGEPICLEHKEIRWVGLDGLVDLPLCPADEKVLKLAIKNIKDYLASDSSSRDK